MERVMRTRAVAAVALSALLVAGSGSAARIAGSSGGDRLRGTGKADVIYGKRGGDTLIGLGGNDVLYPGPGADAVRCGSGRDTVHADWADTISRDCEVVRHQSPAAVGAFSGTSSQNERVTFRVPAGGKTLTSFRINSLNQSCDPANHVATFGPLDYGTAVYPLSQQGAFTASYVGPGTIGGYSAKFQISTRGKVVGRSASGTARFDLSFTDMDGTLYHCTSGDVTWTATIR